jgi:hydroxymethylglutaryl-CoA synthase
MFSVLLLPGNIDLGFLDAVLFHSPYGKLVQKSLARLLLNDFVRTPEKDRCKKYPGLEHLGYVKQISRKSTL